MAYQDVDNEFNEKIGDGYYGNGGFIDGTYLIQSNVETDTKFAYRKLVASYENPVKTIVNANVLPIFNGVNRLSKQPLTVDMMNDIDGSGRGIRPIMRNLGLEASLFGFMVAFWDSETEQPKYASEAKQLKTYPKLIKVKPQQIDTYELESENVLSYLRYITGTLDSGEIEYTVYDNGVWYQGQYFTNDSNEKEFRRTNEETEALQKPMILTFQPYQYEDILPVSPYASLVKQADVIYQLGSFIAYQCMQATFSFLHTDDQNLTADDFKLNEHSIIKTKEGTKLAVVTFPDSTAQIQNRIDAMKATMYNDYNLSVLSTSANASGESRKESDKIRIQELQDKALTMRDFEKELVYHYQQIVKEQDDYILEYPSDFETSSLDAYVETTTKLIDTGISPENASFERAKLMNMANPNASEAQKKTFIANEQNNIDYGDTDFSKDDE